MGVIAIALRMVINCAPTARFKLISYIRAKWYQIPFYSAWSWLPKENITDNVFAVVVWLIYDGLVFLVVLKFKILFK